MRLRLRVMVVFGVRVSGRVETHTGRQKHLPLRDGRAERGDMRGERLRAGVGLPPGW